MRVHSFLVTLLTVAVLGVTVPRAQAQDVHQVAAGVEETAVTLDPEGEEELATPRSEDTEFSEQVETSDTGASEHDEFAEEHGSHHHVAVDFRFVGESVVSGEHAGHTSFGPGVELELPIGDLFEIAVAAAYLTDGVNAVIPVEVLAEVRLVDRESADLYVGAGPALITETETNEQGDVEAHPHFGGGAAVGTHVHVREHLGLQFEGNYHAVVLDPSNVAHEVGALAGITWES